ncbi:MAG: hypothetical protein H6739_38415 [Alphaproteobacteria bacterium]|nr:hypothetical protein [Alphaproteobacteria bacterium]
MNGPRRALVRGLSDRYTDATVHHFAHEGPINLTRARAQHARYVRALERIGLNVRHLPGDPRLPDCCFVEDMAVVSGHVALITRSGLPSRRPEADAVRRVLCEHLDVRLMQAPARLDGGDVLKVGRVMFVGQGARTNAEGAAILADTFMPRGYTIRPVPLPDTILHLKSVCSSPAPGLVVLAEGTLDPALFDGLARVVTIPAEETYAANTLGCNGKALVPRGYPRTRAALEAAGLEVIGLEMSEIRKGDGSLTCLSVWY